MKKLILLLVLVLTIIITFGQDPIYTSNVKTSIADGANLDAFGRLRVSQTHSLFDAQMTYDLQPLLFGQEVNETGATITHDAVNRQALMTFTSTPTGGYAYMQSFEHFRYTSGNSQLVIISCDFDGGTADVLKFVGYSDGTEGVEIQMNGLTPQIALLSTTDVGDQVITQTNWNKDKLDGTGASGITLDFSKPQIYVIDLQALYVGRVRVGVNVSGVYYYMHEFNNANNVSEPYIKSANLPVRCGMSCTGTVSSTMKLICSTVKQEDGSFTAEGFHFAQNATVTAPDGANIHAISIRPKLLFNGIENRSKFILENVDVLVTGTSPVRWQLCLGDVITGTITFNDVNSTYSTFEYNVDGTTSGSPAIVIAEGYVGATKDNKGASSNQSPFKYPLTLDIDGSSRDLGTLTLLLYGIGGASACEASIEWTEIR